MDNENRILMAIWPFWVINFSKIPEKRIVLPLEIM